MAIDKAKELEKMKRYLLLKRLIPKIVRRTIKVEDGEIIQGERSLEAQLPDRYKRETVDYDAYSPVPKQSARETEKELDWEFGGDYFSVRPGVHKGTYKVVSNIDGESYADYTRPSEKVYATKIGDTKYTTLKFELMKAMRILKSKQYAYRHQKEKNKIRRITSALKEQLKNPKNLKGVKMRWL
jgi:hypothetical protein